jgi:hypothetical protein
LQQRFGLECFFIYVNCGRRQERRGRKYSKGVVSEKEGMGEKFTRNADQDQSSLECGHHGAESLRTREKRQVRRRRCPPPSSGQSGTAADWRADWCAAYIRLQCASAFGRLGQQFLWHDRGEPQGVDDDL